MRTKLNIHFVSNTVTRIRLIAPLYITLQNSLVTAHNFYKHIIGLVHNFIHNLKNIKRAEN